MKRVELVRSVDVLDWTSVAEHVRITVVHTCIDPLDGQDEEKVFYEISIGDQVFGAVRFSQLRNIHLRLKREFGSDYREKFGLGDVRFPRRHMFGELTSEHLERRREKLETFLRQVASVKQLGSSSALVDGLAVRSKIIQHEE